MRRVARLVAAVFYFPVAFFSRPVPCSVCGMAYQPADLTMEPVSGDAFCARCRPT